MDFINDYKGLIFDCDGTLTDSMPLHYVAWRDTMSAYGITFPEERFYAMGGMPSEQIIEILATEQRVTIEIVKAAQQKEAAFVETIDQLRPLEAVCEIARSHHGRIPMAVASGGIRSAVLAQLERVAIGQLFPVVVTAEDTQKHKPEPDAFLEAARLIDVVPERCLVFEDSPLGIEAAQRAGMDCIDVRDWSHHRC